MTAFLAALIFSSSFMHSSCLAPVQPAATEAPETPEQPRHTTQPAPGGPGISCVLSWGRCLSTRAFVLAVQPCSHTPDSCSRVAPPKPCCRT
ncbi:hypothetical protein F5Y08DRAFT_156937 [Xylaria arbuscula]|nr:hypothetical protein F5Y08DRAFT_156937 [Xylaria arbuscula]